MNKTLKALLALAFVGTSFACCIATEVEGPKEEEIRTTQIGDEVPQTPEAE